MLPTVIPGSGTVASLAARTVGPFIYTIWPVRATDLCVLVSDPGRDVIFVFIAASQ